MVTAAAGLAAAFSRHSWAIGCSVVLFGVLLVAVLGLMVLVMVWNLFTCILIPGCCLCIYLVLASKVVGFGPDLEPVRQDGSYDNRFICMHLQS